MKLLAQDTEHFEVVAVLTRPDAPTGRGRKLVANPVKQAVINLPQIICTVIDSHTLTAKLNQNIRGSFLRLTLHFNR